MKTSAIQQPTHRKLLIDFNLYTDGEPKFKNELIDLMIANLTELMQSMKEASRENNFLGFKKTSHKVNVTLQMLADPEFDELINGFISNDSAFSEQFTSKGEVFFSFCESIIRSLKAERE